MISWARLHILTFELLLIAGVIPCTIPHIFTLELLLIAGVIPRAVSQIFNGMEERRSAAMERDEPQPQFELTAQFLEVG